MPTCLLGVVVRESETLFRVVGIVIVEPDTETTIDLTTLFRGVGIVVVEPDSEESMDLTTLLKDVTLELAEVDEDSMAFASAMETFAFPLAKLVTQTLI